MADSYHDFHEVRPLLCVGSRPADPLALVGQFQAVLDLRPEPPPP